MHSTQFTRHITVDWDTTTDEYPKGDPSAILPKHVTIPTTINDDDVADWLSDTYGWCVLSWH